MTERTDAEVETVARVFRLHLMQTTPWGEATPVVREHWRRCARAVLTALAEVRGDEIAADWLADHDCRVKAEALREFADTRGVNVGDEDGEWWDGYRQAQRECLHDAADRAERIEAGS